MVSDGAMNRTSFAYLASHGLSMLGNSTAAVVLPLVVLQTTGSALDAGVVASAAAVPAVLAGLVMGSVIDRVHRRSASVATDMVSAVAVAALPLVDLVTGLSVGWFVLFGIIGSFGDVPGLTAREALVPHVAQHSGLSVDRLVALREGVGAFTMLVGPAVAAGLVVLLDGSGALWITAATSAAAASVTLLLPRDVGAISGGPVVGTSPRAQLAHLREGWTTLLRNPFLFSVTALSLLLATVLTAIQGLLLPVHFTGLGQEGRLGLVLSALAAGMLVGAGGHAVWGTLLPRRSWFVAGLFVSCAGVALLGSLPPIAFVLSGAGLLGVAGGLLATVTGALMNERIPDTLRGRVTGTQNAVLTAAPALGVLGAGVAVEFGSLSLAGVLVIVVWSLTVVGALLAPALRDLEPSPPALMVQ